MAEAPTAGVSPEPVASPSPAPAVLPPQLDSGSVPADASSPMSGVSQSLSEPSATRAIALADVEQVAVSTPTPGGVRLGGGRVIASVTFTLRDGTDRVPGRGVRGHRWAVQPRLHRQPRDPPLHALRRGQRLPRRARAARAPAEIPGRACATPMPDVGPAVAERAAPLEIAARDIPITATGHLEIDMGRATLPNGILSDARFTLADVHTRAFRVEDGIRLEVRSLDPSRPPFDNIYQHGWYPGTENVEVYLVLDVTLVHARGDAGGPRPRRPLTSLTGPDTAAWHTRGMANRVRVTVEAAEKKVFVSALDWPGWSRSGKTEELAVEAFLAAAPRYAVVAKAGGIGLRCRRDRDRGRRARGRRCRDRVRGAGRDRRRGPRAPSMPPRRSGWRRSSRRRGPCSTGLPPRRPRSCARVRAAAAGTGRRSSAT